MPVQIWRPGVKVVLYAHFIGRMHGYLLDNNNLCQYKCFTYRKQFSFHCRLNPNFKNIIGIPLSNKPNVYRFCVIFFPIRSFFILGVEGKRKI